MAWASFPGVEFDLSPLLQGSMWLSHQNVLISPLLLVLWLQNIKRDHQKSWPSNVLTEKKFGLKNRMAAIANYLKIRQML